MVLLGKPWLLEDAGAIGEAIWCIVALRFTVKKACFQ